MAATTNHCLVIITCGSEDEARTIARRLVEARLVAGAQILAIESVYRWEGEVVEDEEWLLIVKTNRARYEQIETAVTDLHSYDVVPIYMIDMDRAHQPYLAWIDKVTDV